jgi:hypothetical protein
MQELPFHCLNSLLKFVPETTSIDLPVDAFDLLDHGYLLIRRLVMLQARIQSHFCSIHFRDH